MNTRRSNTVINAPNILTIIRLLLTPLFVILLIRDQRAAALMVFLLAGISDGLDGFIARWFNQRTVLGAYLDPVADKVLLMSAYICLAVLDIVPAWLTIIVLSRDILIVIGIAIFTLTEKKFKVRPSRTSKCTTTVQLLTVLISLVALDISQLKGPQTILLWTTAGLTAITGLHYIFIGLNILQQAENE
jgi:cardiolipin synthase